jgi:hypothetical protein
LPPHFKLKLVVEPQGLVDVHHGRFRALELSANDCNRKVVQGSCRLPLLDNTGQIEVTKGVVILLRVQTDCSEALGQQSINI